MEVVKMAIMELIYVVLIVFLAGCSPFYFASTKYGKAKIKDGASFFIAWIVGLMSLILIIPIIGLNIYSVIAWFFVVIIAYLFFTLLPRPGYDVGMD